MLANLSEEDMTDYLGCNKLVAKMVLQQINERKQGPLQAPPTALTAVEPSVIRTNCQASCNVLRLELATNDSFRAYMSAKNEYWKVHDARHNIQFERTKHFDATHTLLGHEHRARSAQKMHTVCSQIMCKMLENNIWNNFMPLSILNLCSAPGGFDTVLTAKFPDCQITSVSLPQSSGGMAYLAPTADENHEIHQICFMEADVIRLAQTQWSNSGMQDLVILGGSSLGGDPDATTPKDLLMAQCAVAYRHLKVGGRLVLRTTSVHKPLAAATFCTLLCNFNAVDVHKPLVETSGSMWHNSFEYIVFDGFKLEQREATAMSNLFQAIVGSPTDVDSSPALDEQLTEEYVKVLCDSHEPIWQQQACAFIQETCVLSNSNTSQDARNMHTWDKCHCGMKKQRSFSQCAKCWEACSIPLGGSTLGM